MPVLRRHLQRRIVHSVGLPWGRSHRAACVLLHAHPGAPHGRGVSNTRAKPRNAAQGTSGEDNSVLAAVFFLFVAFVTCPSSVFLQEMARREAAHKEKKHQVSVTAR
jgi:hypothetical protein